MSDTCAVLSCKKFVPSEYTVFYNILNMIGTISQLGTISAVAARVANFKIKPGSKGPIWKLHKLHPAHDTVDIIHKDQERHNVSMKDINDPQKYIVVIDKRKIGTIDGVHESGTTDIEYSSKQQFCKHTTIDKNSTLLIDRDMLNLIGERNSLIANNHIVDMTDVSLQEVVEEEEEEEEKEEEEKQEERTVNTKKA